MGVAVAKTSSSVKFETYQDQVGNYRWRLMRNGLECIAVSADGFATIEQCHAGIKQVHKDAGEATIMDFVEE